ncbi:MAG: type II toxin-antitoxin system VapC family toxin [Methylacidiphilales bacterium]|nr:type II toxin-antitoxin system VapC family toxin [Candidatus Methylacidiphilales bacterium]
MLYLDTSSLLKYLLPEPGDEAAEAAIHREEEVAVSQLAELEAAVQLRARHLGGALRPRLYHALLAKLQALDKESPFVFQALSGQVFPTALRQHRKGESVHCRSLDRLHLAAMEELGITRLMTHDARQAMAARALGFEVITP